MPSLSLTYGEFLEAVQTCASVRMTACPAPVLRDFIAARLAAHSPALAAKIRQFGDAQMDLLGAAIQSMHRSFA